ncbi:YdjC-like protein [Lachnospiraceae bacterium XBB2008]|nr:YdjC-like protein [Lachnospiraceae bacterium XBB2008]
MDAPKDLRIDYHGDDYAASINNSKRMLELIRAGKLDSISIFPNMAAYTDCMEMLCRNWDSFEKKPALSIHLNLIDGHSLSGCDDPLLCNEDGYMCASWGKLFIRSYIPGKKRTALRNNICAELKAQIERVYEDYPKDAALRLDSHVHTHMIPMVFEALFDALTELDLLDSVEYIRIPDEPLSPFIFSKELSGTIPLVNIIKNRVLHILSRRAVKNLDRFNISHCPFWGVCMTGRMDRKRMEKAAPKVLDAARKYGDTIEIICHPGIVKQAEDSPEFGPDDRRAFFSKDRDVEYNAVMNRSI